MSDIDVTRDMFEVKYISNNDNDGQLDSFKYDVKLLRWEPKSLEIKFNISHPQYVN